MHGHAALPALDETAGDRAQVVRRLAGLLRPYWKFVLGALLLIGVSAAAQGVGPFLIGLAVDRFIAGGDRPGLALTMLALVAVYLASMLSMRFQIYLLSSAGQRVLADLRGEVLEKVHRLSIQTLEEDEAGDLMSRLVSDIEAVNAFLSQGLAQSLGAAFALLGIVTAMLLLNPQLALAALAVIPLMLVITNLFARRARTAFRKTRETIGDVSAEMQEELGGVKVAQAFNRGQYNVQRFARRNAANRDANVSANAVTAAFSPAMEMLSTLDMAVVAGYGGWLAVQGAVSVGVVVAFLQYVQNFFRPLQTVAQIWTQAQSAFAAAERVFELLDSPALVQDMPGAVDLPAVQGRVVFGADGESQGVSFGYQPGRLALEDIRLEIEPGQTVALVGHTGAGKSTLAALLLRFYDVEQGTISVDGHDIRQVTQRSLRRQMALVSQEPFLFSGSLADNIRYGRPEASQTQIEAAARAANAHDFIARMPEGYDSQVGERGSRLSLGQRQLIAIARAVLAEPRILILDEATASIDTRTEAQIQRALGELQQGRTSLVIAHRLATIRRADQVLVLDQGRIVERGTHAELLAHDGLYAQFYARQSMAETELEPSSASQESGEYVRAKE